MLQPALHDNSHPLPSCSLICHSTLLKIAARPPAPYGETRWRGAVGPVNVGDAERYGSILGGAALVGFGLSRRSLPGFLLAAVGGMFLVRGTAGTCKLYEALGVSTVEPGKARSRDRTDHRIEKTIVINRPPEELFQFWRNLENLPEFMDQVQSVTMTDDFHSHWVVKGPAGQELEWDAEIVNEHPGEMISWQTMPGADVQSAGSVRFTAADGGGTSLRVVLEFRPPGGALGVGISRLLGNDPASQLDQDLNRLKQIMETGRISSEAR